MKTFIESMEKNSQLLIQNSELLMRNKFQFVHPYDMEPCQEIVTFSKEILWNDIPFDDIEWCFMLNRQEYLMDLCLSFEKDRNNSYLLKGKEILVEWINENSNEENWRTIDTGIRLVYWKILLDYLLKEQLIDEEELELVRTSVTQQLVYLDENYIEKYHLSNWGVLITSGYFIIQLLFEECASVEMNQRMLARLEKQIYLQIQPSGNHWEQSPLYFMEVLRSFSFLHVSKAIKDPKINQQLETTILLMYQFMPHFITPEKTSILQGDTDEMIIDDVVQTIALLYNRSIPNLFTDEVLVDYPMLHLSQKKISFSQWKEGINYLRDDNFSNKLFDDYSGNYYYRSDWSQESSYFHLYNGSLGSGHGHLSLGHVDLTMEGTNLLVDSGRFTYVESDIRRKLKESSHHNTVIINNQPFGVVKDSWGYEKVPTSLANRFIDQENYVAVRSMYLDQQEEGMMKVIRTIIYFKKEKDFLIIDQVVDNAVNFKKMSRNFHLNPEIKIVENSTSQFTFNAENKSSIFGTFSENQLTILNTEYSPQYNEIKNSLKIETTSSQPCQYLYLTRTKPTEIKKIKIRKSDNKEVEEKRCIGIEIIKEDTSYLIHSSIEDTFNGHKLYFLNDKPVYGQLSIHKIKGNKSEYIRLL